MLVQRFYLQCLAHASYVIADLDSGEAAVVDPQRDTGQYEDFLRERGLRLKYVLETHLHADFVSGHVELARKTGAEIVFSHRAEAAMPHRAVGDGDVLQLGEGLRIAVLETPGHTPESVCYLAEQPGSEGPGMLFSGDTVFVGDVGRPDLLGELLRPEALAGMLFDSIRNKIMTLPDDTLIYPAHGAGSSCGRALGSDEFTTVGREKATNYAFKLDREEDFVEAVTFDQPEAPKYFGEDAKMNRAGAVMLDAVLDRLQALEPRQVREHQTAGAFVLDTRDMDDFARAAVPGSVNISLDGQFAGWVGSLVPGNVPIVLVANEQAEMESAVRCARIGYDRVVGYLAGGIDAWRAAGYETVAHDRLEPEQLAAVLTDGEVNPARSPLLLDVRKVSEREKCFIPGSEFVTLSELATGADRFDRDRPVVVYCQGGYRSSMAVGILRKLGFADVRDLRGGIQEYRAAGLPIREAATAQP